MLVTNKQTSSIYSLADIQAKACTVLMRPEEPQRRLLEKKYTYLKVKETDKITSQSALGAINDVLEEEGACAAIYPAISGWKYLSLAKNCDVMLNPIDDSEFKFGGGYITNSDNETECKPKLFVAMNTLLLDMEVDGALNAILSNYSYFQTGKDPASDECAVGQQYRENADSSDSKVSLEQLAVVAIIAGLVILISVLFAIYKIIYPNQKSILESRTSSVDWEHESYPFDWQHQVFKRMLHQAEDEMGKESNNDDSLGNRRLSLSQNKNVEVVMGEIAL